MAFKINTFQPVEIGGKECKPEINTELKLRLSQINNYTEEADEVLASAFPNDENYVKKKLKDTPVLEKELLHAYLLGGERMAQSVLDRVSQSFNETMKGGGDD